MAVKLEQEVPGSVASTNAKAALGMRLTIWFSVICAIGFLYCVVTPGKDQLADNILWGYLLYLSGFQGFNVVQRKWDRESDYGLEERKRGYPTPDGRVPGQSEVQREVSRTVTTETSKRETVGSSPAVQAPVISTEPDARTDDERGDFPEREP